MLACKSFGYQTKLMATTCKVSCHYENRPKEVKSQWKNMIDIGCFFIRIPTFLWLHYNDRFLIVYKARDHWLLPNLSHSFSFSCYFWRMAWIKCCPSKETIESHDDVIKWKHFPRYWPFVRGIHRSPVNSPHKGQWRGALMFTLICTRIYGWVNNREAGDLRRYRAHYDVIVMSQNRSLHWFYD